MTNGSADDGSITAQGRGVLNTARRVRARARDNLRAIGQREAVHYFALGGLRGIAALQLLVFHLYHWDWLRRFSKRHSRDKSPLYAGALLPLAYPGYALVEKPGIDAGKRLLARSGSGALP